jgi:hypothetical protein
MNEMDDKHFADKVLKGLPTVAVSQGLEARILADFDRLSARRPSGVLAMLSHGWSERLWPGAPVWQPISLLALSLIVGLTAGAFLPSPQATTSADTMLVADSMSVTDFYKDL